MTGQLLKINEVFIRRTDMCFGFGNMGIIRELIERSCKEEAEPIEFRRIENGE